MKRKVLVIHGPNLNLLGKREPGLYGGECLESVNKKIEDEAKRLEISVEIFQSNSEGAIVDRIQESMDKVSLIIINAGAYTHTSVAIRDALLAVGIPSIEVHLSNIYKREDFRKRSYLADISTGQISGFGYLSYILALRAAEHFFENS